MRAVRPRAERLAVSGGYGVVGTGLPGVANRPHIVAVMLYQPILRRVLDGLYLRCVSEESLAGARGPTHADVFSPKCFEAVDDVGADLRSTSHGCPIVFRESRFGLL